MNALVYVNIDQGIHEVKLKNVQDEKRKKLHGFSFYINIANFEAFFQGKKLSANLLFLQYSTKNRGWCTLVLQTQELREKQRQEYIYYSVLEELFRKIYKPTISLYLHSLSLYKSNVEQKILLYYLLSVLRNISYICIAMIVFIFSYIYLLLLYLYKIHPVLMVSTIQKNLQNYRNIDQVEPNIIQYHIHIVSCYKLESRSPMK